MQYFELLREFLDNLGALYEQNEHQLSVNLKTALKQLIKDGNRKLAQLAKENGRVQTEETNTNQEKQESGENKTQENELRRSVEELTKELKSKDIEIKSLRERVAFYSEKLTKQDQRHVEDTLSLNRQSEVERDYKNFTSGERIDACVIIEKKYKEKTNVNAKRLACFIFETTFEYMWAVRGALTDALKEISNFTIANGSKIAHFYHEQRRTNVEKRGGTITINVEIPLCRSGSRFSRGVLSELLLCIKESAPDVSADLFLESIANEIMQRIAEGHSTERSCKLNPSRKLIERLYDYIRACIKLTWRMVTQVPPMRLEYQNFTFDRAYHKMIDPQGELGPEKYAGKEILYLWPGLVDGGGTVVNVAEVIEKIY